MVKIMAGGHFIIPMVKLRQRQNLINLDKESVNGNITTKMEN